jgi:hypothetical protein
MDEVVSAAYRFDLEVGMLGRQPGVAGSPEAVHGPTRRNATKPIVLLNHARAPVPTPCRAGRGGC